MVGTTNPHPLHSKRKAISALFPYVICLEQDQGMVDAISRAVVVSNSAEFVWYRIRPYIATLFDKPRPSSLNLVITMMSPHVFWSHRQYSYDENTVTRWAKAASEVQPTKEVDRSVVDALLYIASNSSLRPHIPIELWARMKDQRSPLSRYPGDEGHERTSWGVVLFVRELGDVEILKSYFLLVWSEWNSVDYDGLCQMVFPIREYFGGSGMRNDRRDLIERLDQVLGQLDRGLEYLRQHDYQIQDNDVRINKHCYGQLKAELLKLDREEVSTLPIMRLPSQFVLTKH
jgi:hypothetical protein